MGKSKKPSNKQTISDKLAEMPKETKGQRIKYLLKKQGMSQMDLAKKLYDENNEGFGSFYSNLNMKLSDTARRNLTYDDVKTIAKVLDASPQYIMEGGYENLADALAHTINEMNEEASLLHSAFYSLAFLAGYNIKKVGLHGLTFTKSIRSQFDEFIIIEHDGKEVSLTIEQFNNLENIIFDHAEITIKRFLEACGKEVR